MGKSTMRTTNHLTREISTCMNKTIERLSLSKALLPKDFHTYLMTSNDLTECHRKWPIKRNNRTFDFW